VVPIKLFQPGDQKPRRPTKRFGGDESCGVESKSSRLGRRWHAHHQYDGFTTENLKYANYASNPLEDSSLAGFRVHKLPISTLNMNALKGNVELSRKEIDRSKELLRVGCALLALRSSDGKYARLDSRISLVRIRSWPRLTKLR